MLGRLKSPAIQIGVLGLLTIIVLRLAVASSRYCKVEFGGRYTEHKTTDSLFESTSLQDIISQSVVTGYSMIFRLLRNP